MAQLPNDIHTYLAWQFDAVLPGVFRRNKADYAHIEFPILAPLPTRKASTPPLEGAAAQGPFIYFVVDQSSEVQYVGKSKEKTVIKRWVRPGVGGPGTHYWTHTNTSAGCVRRIAEGIQLGHGPFRLRFVGVHSVPPVYASRFAAQYSHLDALERAEKGFMSLLRPKWNDPKSYK
jgi:hypothetical protein